MDTNAATPTPLDLESSILSDVVPVILSGGSGSRLWPVSRESFPKQFWGLLNHDRSMIVETALRGRGPGFAAPVMVCNQEHRFLVAEQLRDAGITGARIVLEPVGRNSAPAVAAAALLVAQTDPRAVIWMMPADAAIGDVEQLHTILADGGRGCAGRPDRDARDEGDRSGGGLRLHGGGRSDRRRAGGQ